MSAFARDPDNHYVEPAWVSRRLFEVERFAGRIVDPCAGFGTMVASARLAGLQADGFDLRARTAQRLAELQLAGPVCGQVLDQQHAGAGFQIALDTGVRAKPSR